MAPRNQFNATRPRFYAPANHFYTPCMAYHQGSTSPGPIKNTIPMIRHRPLTAFADCSRESTAPSSNVPDVGFPETDAWDTGATCDDAENACSVPYPISPAPDGWDVLEDRSTKTGTEDLAAKNQPSVDSRTSVRVSADAQTDDDAHGDDHHVEPLRLAHRDINGKIRALTGEWIKRLAGHGLEPTQDFRGQAGRAIRVHIENGRTNRELIDMVRHEADRIARQERAKTSEQRRDEEAQQRANAEFAEFFSTYPRQSAEDRAVKAWNNARRAGASASDLIAAARYFAKRFPPGGRNSLPYPHTWLNSGQWRRYAPNRAA